MTAKPGPPNTSDVQNAGQECKITFAPSTQPQQCYSISKPDNLKLFGKNPRWSNEDFSNHVTPNPIGWSRIWPLVGLPDYHDCWVPFWYYRCFVCCFAGMLFACVCLVCVFVVGVLFSGMFHKHALSATHIRHILPFCLNIFLPLHKIPFWPFKR